MSGLVINLLGCTNKGKTLITWRAADKTQQLYESLFAMAVAKGIHLKKNGEKRTLDARWDELVAELFKTPPFSLFEGSIRSVRDHYEKTMDEVARHHGWLDENGARTGNLSGGDGDLPPLESNI